MTNDPLTQVMINTLHEMRDLMTDYRRNFSCGCPESRLCRHPELNGIEEAEGMIDDHIYYLEKKK